MKCWAYILRISSLVVIKRFGIKSGVLVFDDTDRGRENVPGLVEKYGGIRHEAVKS
jgi:hypothetical protein